MVGNPGPTINACARTTAGPHSTCSPGAPAVMLLHGVTLTTELNWSAVIPELAGPFRVLAFDQRGHGDGLDWPGGYRLEDCADDVAAVAAALGIDQLIVIGYSMGGLIAQLVWQRHRQLTAGLVLCATARNMADPHLTPSAALLPPAPTTPAQMALGPALPGWTLPGLGTAALGLAATQGWLAAVAALRADLLGRYLLDAGGTWRGGCGRWRRCAAPRWCPRWPRCPRSTSSARTPGPATSPCPPL
jgi:pimeloyl-ACP methyl ester carboxylesterase